jgi:Tfp pilus assembly protein PilX
MSKNLQKNQNGMVSIMITMIMMIVITLIVLGFAAVTRRNQREALDNQLSSQAYYAAETGVNDAIHAIDPANPAHITPTAADANSCGSFITHAGLGSTSTLSSGVKYTCVLVNENPPALQQTVALGSTQTLPVNPSAATDLTVSWQSTNSTATGAGCPSGFTPSASWIAACQFGVLRLDIYKTGGVTLTGSSAAVADGLASKVGTVYVSPSSAGSLQTRAIDYTKPITAPGYCSSGSCKIRLQDVGGAAFAGNYYVRLSGIYEAPGNVVIAGDSTAITFSGAFASIDSTGQDQDELRRIQVYVPLTNSSGLPAVNALASVNDICKQFSILGPNTSATSTNPGNPLCNT